MKVKIEKIVTEKLSDFSYYSDDVIIVSRKKDIIPDPKGYNSDVGLDMYSYLPEGNIPIAPGSAEIIPSGIKVACPPGLHFEVRPRSSLFLKTKLMVANTPGTIDPDYRGDVGMILYNTNNTPYIVKNNTKLCQMCLIPYIPLNATNYCVNYNCTYMHILYFLSENIYINFEKLAPSNRGINGFGSTGGYK